MDYVEGKENDVYSAGPVLELQGQCMYNVNPSPPHAVINKVNL